MFRKKIKCIGIILLIIGILFAQTSLASTKVTNENLYEALQKITTSESVVEAYKISMENNIITLTNEENNESLKMNYDLTNQPTFSYEVEIKQGMTYEKFKSDTDNLISTMIGYIAVANIQGVEAEDSVSYFLLNYLSSALASGNTNSYVIVDDLNISEGTEIEKNNNSNTIYTSEFGNRVMEYVNAMYQNKQVVSDTADKDGINSFELTIEKKDTTDTSCKLVSTMKVNTEADYSKLVGFSKKMGEDFLNKNITKENADIVIELKIGQKCKIEADEKITGSELSGYDCVDFSNNYTEITAKSEGIKNGYLYFGNNQEKKSVYIVVEKNDNNETLNTKTIKVELNKENNNNNQQNNNTLKEDNTKINAKKIFQAGLKNSTILISIGTITVITTVICIIKIKKYKDIK